MYVGGGVFGLGEVTYCVTSCRHIVNMHYER